MHLFEEKGIIIADVSGKGESEGLVEVATDHAIETGAEDVKALPEGCLEFVCGATNLNKVVGGLEKFDYKILSASVEYIPVKVQELNEEDLQICAKMYEKLEALPEVVRLSDNIA